MLKALLALEADLWQVERKSVQLNKYQRSSGHSMEGQAGTVVLSDPLSHEDMLQVLLALEADLWWSGRAWPIEQMP
jgi:hypothetical protein